MRNIRQNLFFAFVFNAAAVPIAAGVPGLAFELHGSACGETEGCLILIQRRIASGTSFGFRCPRTTI